MPLNTLLLRELVSPSLFSVSFLVRLNETYSISRKRNRKVSCSLGVKGAIKLAPVISDSSIPLKKPTSYTVPGEVASRNELHPCESNHRGDDVDISARNSKLYYFFC